MTKYPVDSLLYCQYFIGELTAPDTEQHHKNQEYINDFIIQSLKLKLLDGLHRSG